MSIRYLDIRRMSETDGPGLRTTIVLKGCSLACKWCHSPESIPRKRQVVRRAARCLGCGSCLAACPQGALTMTEDGGIAIDHRRCAGCLACVQACPAGARESIGVDAEPAELVCALIEDRDHFGADGGVTLSGGEPLVQEDAVELLRLLQAERIQTALDTCGMAFPGQLERALRYTDLLIYDLKLMDNAEHRRLTGQGNAMVLRNLGVAAKWAKSAGRLWIRTPVIPGATDTPENIRAVGKRIAAIGCAERWELCVFNDRCVDKYRRLDLEWAYADTPLMTRAHMEALLAEARVTRACPDIRCTGAVREEASI